ncbi:hypothetical protein MSG28_010461 [Choristoneura fumiferana]|uniref:Uncharacterized protein n=1 Tax=Choristoneura fumiferana TaxID=7141 RepID=A0ACC0KLE6_CHOFU|nr:hypothetical protein MSG28_010461 [Choristoneura fumiferana]
MFICQKHFEKRFISSKSRLLVAAYPSLFTEDEISSGIPSQANIDTDVIASTSSESPRLSEDPVPSTSSAISVTMEPIASSSALESYPLLNTDNRLGLQEQLVAAEHSENYNLSHGPAAGSSKIRSAKGTMRRRRRLIEKITNMTPECKIIMKSLRSQNNRWIITEELKEP